MPVVLTDRSQLLTRHQARFSAVLQKAESLMVEAAYEEFTEVVAQFSGASGQPQGDTRKVWLANERPFARGGFHGASPNPVGVISGDLLNSLSYTFTSTGPVFATKSFSSGIDYVKYLLAPDGTINMVPRMVRQHMDQWATMRIRRVGHDVQVYMRSLI